MNHYKILGLSQNATKDQIKAAYKKQVKENHPDIGGDSEQFKQIVDAYETLIDDQKRKYYDNVDSGNHSQRFQQSYNPFDEEKFQDIFSRKSYKNKDIIIPVTLELKDVILGKNLILQYTLNSGAKEVVTIDIPPGVDTNSTIRYQELGDDSLRHIPRGDLLIRVKIRPQHDWVRDGVNLATRRIVNVFDLLLGCVILIETPDHKKVKMNVPKGTNPGKILSIRGYGIPDSRQGIRGNLYVQIDCAIPDISDEKMLSQLTEIRNNIEEN